MTGRALLLVALAVTATSGVDARLRFKGNPEAGHQLDAAGANGGDKSGAEANPKIDAWHAKEKKKIEEECDDRLAGLKTRKRLSAPPKIEYKPNLDYGEGAYQKPEAVKAATKDDSMACEDWRLPGCYGRKGDLLDGHSYGNFR